MMGVTPEAYARLVSEYVYPLPGLPTPVELSLRNPAELFTFAPQANVNSIRLFIWGLAFLKPLLVEFERTQQPEVADIITGVVTAFLDQMSDKEHREFYNSEDHAMYMRTVILAWYLDILGDREQAVSARIMSFVARQAEWLYDDDQYTPNNHGAMQDLALLYSYLLVHQERLKDKALERLDRLVCEIFDEEGFCCENTVEYWVFDIRLFKDIVDVLRRNQLEGPVVDTIIARLETAESSLAHVLYDDGTVPNIGDAGSGRVVGGPSSTGTRFFRKGNFVVSKDATSYLAFHCGFTSLSHKQCDDLSIVWNVHGKDIFCDSGLNNYDLSDPVTDYVRGVRGHSGCYPTCADAFPAWLWQRQLLDGEAAITEFAFDEGDGALTASGSYRLSEARITVMRRVSKRRNLLFIEDSFTADTAQDFRTRFVLHPEAHVAITGPGTVTVEIGGVVARIAMFSSPGSADGFELSTSTGPYSPKMNENQDTSNLNGLLRGVTNGTMWTMVEVDTDSVVETDKVDSFTSNPDVDGVQHVEKFGTKLRVSIAGDLLLVNVNCEVDMKLLDFCFYVFRDLEPVYEGRYIRTPHFEFPLSEAGEYRVRVFVKYHDQHYRYCDAFISRSLTYRSGIRRADVDDEAPRNQRGDELERHVTDDMVHFLKQLEAGGSAPTILVAQVPCAYDVKNPSEHEQHIDDFYPEYWENRRQSIDNDPVFAPHGLGLDYVREVCAANSLTARDGISQYADRKGAHVNVVNGFRVTTSLPENYIGTIYLFGPSTIYGFGVDDDNTIASRLQKKVNDMSLPYAVMNCSNMAGSADEEILALMRSMSFSSDDVIVYFTLLKSRMKVLADQFPVCMTQQIFDRPHEHGEVFYERYHLNYIGSGLIAEALLSTLTTMGALSGQRTSAAGTHTTETKRVVPSDADTQGSVDALVKAYGSELAEYVEGLSGLAPRIGSIVMNCNPFTLGHRYLAEYASARCDRLYIFVVEEDKSFFKFADRVDLVRRGTEDLHNVTIIPSGSFIISSLTFDAYSKKEQLQDEVIDPSMDVSIFADYIAPALRINIRFAGEEPLDNVTRQYNDAMKRILPGRGIAFEVIHRKESGGEPVSASRVRALLEKKQFDEIATIVPSTTLEFLKATYG